MEFCLSKKRHPHKEGQLNYFKICTNPWRPTASYFLHPLFSPQPHLSLMMLGLKRGQVTRRLFMFKRRVAITPEVQNSLLCLFNANSPGML